MNISVSATSLITGVFPSAPGAGKGHPFELRAGPFFGGELQVVSLRGRERVNDVYQYEVTFVTEQAAEVVTTALFGLPACLTIKSPGHDPRVIQGIASSVEAVDVVAGEWGTQRRRYRLEIVPTLWLLRHRRQNRVFQNKSVPDIVRAVLGGVGIKDSDCRWRADKASYPPLPFVYQRGESDWDFLRRVLASAGIFFFYEHASGFLDSMFVGAAGAVAGAVGAAAGMLGGAVASVVGSVEAAAGMTPVLNFGSAAGHTAAVASALGGLAADALQQGLGALGGALGGVAGSVVGAVASAVEEPSDVLPYDDDQGADADYDRVYEFALKKTVCAKELRMLDRDVETAASWVGVASVPDVGASLNLAAGLSSLASGGLGAAAKSAVSFDVDAPTIAASMLRQELYQADLNVWRDSAPPGAPPAASLSASMSVGLAAGGPSAAVQIGVSVPALPTLASSTASTARLALELERARRKYQQAGGRSDCRRMGAGYRFTLGKHPVGPVNGEYTVTELEVTGIHPDFLGKDEAVYRNRFRCIPSAVAPRPKRPKRRPKPAMEVARVVGFTGGEALPGLEANPVGYVRVRFRWDIVDDTATENGSLQVGTDDARAVWIPVLQPWAGAGYGAQFIPRTGMEVLVGFMEDQSERPVILGCLYSDASPPPWDAYIDHQKVGIRSQSRPADGGYSEVSIDDRQGGEVLQLRAQKDMREDVLNDRVTVISHDRTTTIGNDSALTVSHNRSVAVTNDQSRTVGGNDALTVTGDESQDFRASLTVSVKGKTTETLFGDLQRTLSANAQVDTAGQTRLTFQDDYTERHQGHKTVIVGTGAAHRSAALHVEGDARAYAAKPIEVESLEGISILCGDSQLLISPKGITLSSPTITLVGKEIDGRAQTIAVSATGDLKLGGKTATVQTSGAKLALDSSTAALKASKVQLGSGSGGDSTSSDKPVTVTRVQMKGGDGKPRANARVLLCKGGKDGEQRMTVLDENGMLEILGDDSYQITFPDDAKAK